MTINKPILFYSIILSFLSTCESKGENPRGLFVGNQVPELKATDQFHRTFDRNDQLKKGPIILIFYRGYWCKYCNSQFENLSDSLQYIFDKAPSVITVTPEIIEFVDELSKKYQSSFRIISDTDLKIMEL